MPEKTLTKNGAFETAEDGANYAAWLHSHEGEYDGIVLSLPNFGDENGILVAMRDVKVPILIQAYPDAMDKMDSSHRRDAFCGKVSAMNVLRQANISFTVFEPHTVSPKSKTFERNLQDFASVCRVVNGLKRFTVGMIGARTTPFKTVRFDEITLQKNGITVETFDLSEWFQRARTIDPSSEKVLNKRDHLKNYADCSAVTADKMNSLCVLSVALEDMIADYHLNAVAIRCWREIQTEFGVAPCIVLSELTDRCIEACCETDICNVIMMRALRLASNEPAICMDWNNNYQDDPDKCILFHCGCAPSSFMRSTVGLRIINYWPVKALHASVVTKGGCR